MKPRRFRHCLLALLIGWSVTAPSARDVPVVEFRNGRWFDGRTFVEGTWYAVGGVLHPRRPVTVDRVVDLEGMYVIPACGEAHNHNATNDNPAAVDAYLRAGILYVQNPDNLPGQRAGGRINSPSGIDVTFANGGWTAPGGHPIGLVQRNIARGVMKTEDGEGAFYNTADSVEELERKWPGYLATKPDVVKVYLVYSEEFDRRKDDERFFSRRGLDPALVPLIVERARAAGLPVFAHVETAADFHVAVSSGVSVVNHMPGFWPSDEALTARDFRRYEISDADARLAGRKHIAVVTTLGESLSQAHDPGMAEAAEALRDGYRIGLSRLRKHHVRLLIGSDRFRMTSQAEAVALVDSGLMSPEEALKAWCEVTPRAIFPDRKVGRIGDGYEANLAVLPGSPINEFSVVKDVRRLFKHGEEIAIPAIEGAAPR